MTGYLPKEAPNSTLKKTILKTLWNSKLISKALGVKNQTAAREWFAKNQNANKKFQAWNKEVEKTFKDVQTKADNYLSDFKETRGQKRSANSRKLLSSKEAKK